MEDPSDAEVLSPGSPGGHLRACSEEGRSHSRLADVLEKLGKLRSTQGGITHPHSQLAQADLEAAGNHTVNNHSVWPQLPTGHFTPTLPARGLPNHPLGSSPSPASNEVLSAFQSTAPPLLIRAAPGPGHMHLGVHHSGCMKPGCCEMLGNGLQSSNVYYFPKLSRLGLPTQENMFLILSSMSQSPSPWVLDDRPLLVDRAWGPRLGSEGLPSLPARPCC